MAVEVVTVRQISPARECRRYEIALAVFAAHYAKGDVILPGLAAAIAVEAADALLAKFEGTEAP